MALRYTETNKWKDDWFLSLSNDYRIIWQYIIDNCSVAGLWKTGLKHLNYFCNTNITIEEFKTVFKGRVFEIENGSYFFIPKFLKIQYPSGIKSNKPLIISVRKEVEKFNLNPIIKESLNNDYIMIEQSYKDTGNRKQVNGNIEINKKECEEKIKEILNSHSWIESVAMQNKINYDFLVVKLDEFLQEQNLKEEINNRSIKEIKSHFINWLKIQIEKRGVKSNSAENIISVNEEVKRMIEKEYE